MTDFEDCLREVQKTVNKNRYSKADCIFITDGEDSISAEYVKTFNTNKLEKDFKMISIVVGSTRTPKDLSKVSDEVHHIADFTNEYVDALNHNLFSSI
mgnify:CR=1 FL=1